MASYPLASSGTPRSTGLWPIRSRSQERRVSSPLVQASIARDLVDEPEDLESAMTDETDPDSDSGSEPTTILRRRSSTHSHAMSNSYRRPGFTSAGARVTAVQVFQGHDSNPTRTERHDARREERSLLRDNNVIPPKHPQVRNERSRSRFGKSLNIPGGDKTVVSPNDPNASSAVESGLIDQSETTPLLGDPQLPYGGQDDPESLDKKWEDAVVAGKIKTTWQRETKVISRYSAPLILTFILQYSLPCAGIFTVGHLGKVELGAVTLAGMTSNITGYAVYQGLATSLDTLCAQAYGSGRKKIVGLQMQRMIYFLFVVTIPIAVIWYFSEQLLVLIVPEADVAKLAGLYLKIIILGAPGVAVFESGKRYVQAQGLFSASLYVLLICAPLNALMNYLFVWRFGWGFIGAPIAITITDNLLPLLLFLYVRFVAGRSCWPGFTKRALSNWGPMIKLALPGLLMVEAECLAFEILTLASSYFGTSSLAAQSVLSVTCSLTWQIPFPLSIAASTRIANLIGAGIPGAAKTSAKVALVASVGIGLFNFVLLAALRNYIPYLFTSDPEVLDLVARVMPLCAAFQLFDAVAANCNGILRGLGRQEIGGYVQLFCYYVVAMPTSMGTAFGLKWELYGLWSGVALALGLVSAIELVFIFRANWDRSVEDARRRNSVA